MSNVERLFYPNGSLRAESSFVNGLPHGVHRYWHPNGMLAHETPFDHGIMDGIIRGWYDNGSLRAENSLVKGVPHGVHRYWHPNGVLEKEVCYDHGIEDGIIRQWNDKGELLGSYEIKEGTGLQLTWHPNGQLWSEVLMINGKYTGRYRVYWEDGEVAADTYWLENEKVSKKRYLEACKPNPNLPTYDDPPRSAKKAITWKRKPSKTNASAVDDLAVKLVNEPTAREALSWLTETTQPSRSLGEATGQEASVQLVKELYSLGAVTVYALEIDGGPNEDQNSGRLVVVLPQDGVSRKKLLRFCGRLAREAGFDPDTEAGQRYVLLMLD